MKLVTKKPWWWFITGAKWGECAVTLGSSIYYPKELPPPILEHEKVHIKQCGGSVLMHLFLMHLPLEMYRLMEQEAHQAQYKSALNYMTEQEAYDWVMGCANKNPYGIKIEIIRQM